MLKEDTDPIDDAKAKRADRMPSSGKITFAQVAELYAAKKKPEWSVDEQKQFNDSMKNHVNPIIGKTPVADIDTEAVLKVLKPIWETITETAKRVRRRIEGVLNTAKVLDLRSGENPARWKGHLSEVLSKPSAIATVIPHAAVPYEIMPQFMAQLRAREGVVPRAPVRAVLCIVPSGRDFKVSEGCPQTTSAKISCRRTFRPIPVGGFRTAARDFPQSCNRRCFRHRWLHGGLPVAGDFASAGRFNLADALLCGIAYRYFDRNVATNRLTLHRDLCADFHHATSWYLEEVRCIAR